MNAKTAVFWFIGQNLHIVDFDMIDKGLIQNLHQQNGTCSPVSFVKKFIAEKGIKLKTELIVYLLSSTCLDILKDKISSSQFDISAFLGLYNFLQIYFTANYT